MEYASKGVAGSGLGLGIAGTALGLLNGGAGLVGNGFMSRAYGENTPVNRYDLEKEQKISELESQIALRDANTYSDSKMLELYQYVDGRLRGIESQICQQSVINAQVTANLGCMQNEISTLQGLTKTVIPINNVCPEPMARYNSWTAPTTETTA